MSDMIYKYAHNYAHNICGCTKTRSILCSKIPILYGFRTQ